jgi:hypothetical protein
MSCVAAATRRNQTLSFEARTSRTDVCSSQCNAFAKLNCIKTRALSRSAIHERVGSSRDFETIMAIRSSEWETRAQLTREI